MTALDLSALENVRTRGNRTTARCPACAEAGRDEKGDHLSIDEAGRFACVLHSGPDGAEHRKRIFALKGLPNETKARARLVKAYDYNAADGRLLFQVCRFEPKDFRQRRPDGAGGWLWNMHGITRQLYRLPDVLRAKDAGEAVYLVEGEKDADALAALGLCATCNPGGAGKWTAEYTKTLTGASVVMLPDRDDAGRKHAALVLGALNGKAASVRVVELPDRDGRNVKDAADWTAAGGNRTELDAMVANAPEWTAPETMQPPPPFAVVTASDLAGMELPAPIWFVPDLLPQGATLLCGKPKCGKSWMALSLGCAVASGGVFLSKYRCAQHEVLYLALEDTRRRLKDRLARMLHNERPPSGLHLVTDCPRMPDGLPALETFLDSSPLVRLLILDTLQKFRPPSGFKGVYEGDYDAITPLKQLVDRRGLALLIVHHVRKATADDVFETVSGSHGLTGAVDATLILKRNPGERDGKLHGTGRDLEDVELPVRFGEDGNWSAVEGNATLPPARADLVEAIRQAGRALTAHELAERVGKSLDATKKLLTAAREAGTIIKNPDGLGYALPIYSTYPTSPYKSNPPTPLYSPIGGEQGSMGDQGIHPVNVEVEI